MASCANLKISIMYLTTHRTHVGLSRVHQLKSTSKRPITQLFNLVSRWWCQAIKSYSETKPNFYNQVALKISLFTILCRIGS